jgi:hypothetical protein
MAKGDFGVQYFDFSVILVKYSMPESIIMSEYG